MTHAELNEMLGLYALRALPAGDAAILAAHVAACGDCAGELRELEVAAAELARVPEPITPSAALTGRILGARPAGAARPWRRALRMGVRLAVAAVLAVLVVSHEHLRARLDRAHAVIGRGRELVEFIASPNVTTVPLAALDDAMPGGHVLVAYDRRSGRGIFFATDLPPPPPGAVYQLWAITDGVRPTAVLGADTRGGTVVGDGWPRGGGEPLVFAITLEPAKGTGEPTGPFLFLGTAAQGTSTTRPNAARDSM